MGFFYENNFRVRKEGFTFIEVIAFIIVLAIFATLALSQYGRIAERPRGAEARAIFSLIRYNAAAFYIERGDFAGFSAATAGIGTLNDQAPSGCRASHYFSYAIAWSSPSITITAVRCGAGGKGPVITPAIGKTLVLTSDLRPDANPSDVWTGTGAY